MEIDTQMKTPSESLSNDLINIYDRISHAHNIISAIDNKLVPADNKNMESVKPEWIESIVNTINVMSDKLVERLSDLNLKL